MKLLVDDHPTHLLVNVYLRPSSLLISNLVGLDVELTLTTLRLPWFDSTIPEHILNFLQTFPASFRVAKECLDGSAHAKDAEDDIDFPTVKLAETCENGHECLPLDVFEGGRNEEADGEVEKPVGDRGKAHAVGTGLQ